MAAALLARSAFADSRIVRADAAGQHTRSRERAGIGDCATKGAGHSAPQSVNGRSSRRGIGYDRALYLPSFKRKSHGGARTWRGAVAHRRRVAAPGRKAAHIYLENRSKG